MKDADKIRWYAEHHNGEIEAFERDDGCRGIIGCPQTKQMLFFIASWSDGWDHVSVTMYDNSKVARTPTWAEMDFIKNVFFTPEECALQYHPPGEAKKNVHEFCLHIWRPQNETISLPPVIMV